MASPSETVALLRPWVDVLAGVERLIAGALREFASTAAVANADPTTLRSVEHGIQPAARVQMPDFDSTPDGSSTVDLVRELVEPLRAEPRLTWLCDTFGLDDLDLAIVTLALAPELDLRFERLYAFLQDDGRRHEARVDMCLGLLFRSMPERIDSADRFAPDAALVRHRILAPDRAAGSSLNRVVRLDPQIVRFVLYRDASDPRLAASCRVLRGGLALDQVPIPARERPRVAATLDRGRRELAPARVFLRTADVEQARLLAAAAVNDNGRVLECDLDALARDPEGDRLLQVTFREAWLRSLVLHLGRAQALSDDTSFALRDTLRDELAHSGGTVLLSGDTEWAALELDVSGVLVVDGMELDARDRLAHWRRCAGQVGIDVDDDTLERTAQRFRLRPAQIARATTQALQALESGDVEGTQPVRSALFAAAREQSGRRLASLATRIRPRYGWRDIVLPPDSLAQLHELCARVTQRERVLDEWGFGRRLSQGLGTTVLFAGSSGTGKTMTAEIIAAELGLDLYRINLATIVSKYIGETEKNLDRVFEAAEDANAVLLFDEAEALFGKRSEVRDAHDRYANIEVAYLLQRMEAFPGLAILSTNMRQNLDEAFARRLAFLVSFPFPEAADRQRIWEGMFPAGVPLAPDVDLAAIAERFKLSGGNIKNVALSAAFLAAGERAAVGMRHLLHGTRREFQKLGKTLSDEDLGLPALRLAS